MTPLRVLHVFPSFQIGGPQIRFVELARKMGRQFHHLIISRDGQSQAAALLSGVNNVEVIPSPETQGGLMRRFRAVLKGLRASRCDLLVTYNWGAIEWAAAGVISSVPHIHIADGFGPEEARQRLTRRTLMRRLVLRGNTQVVVPSATLLEIGRREWHIPASRLHKISNGMDITRYCERRDRSLTDLHINPNTPVFGWVGGVRKEKNLERLLGAFARVSVPAVLAIVGDGPQAEHSRKRAQELGISNNVKFLGPRSDIPDLLAGFDALALSSDTEQMPLAVLEAMASGLPIAATDVGDVRKMVSPENIPFIVPLTETDLARAMTALAKDPVLRQEIGRANRSLIARDYRSEDMVNAYRRLFLATIANKHLQPGSKSAKEKREPDDLNVQGLL